MMSNDFTKVENYTEFLLRYTVSVKPCPTGNLRPRHTDPPEVLISIGPYLSMTCARRAEPRNGQNDTLNLGTKTGTFLMQARLSTVLVLNDE